MKNTNHNIFVNNLKERKRIKKERLRKNSIEINRNILTKKTITKMLSRNRNRK